MSKILIIGNGGHASVVKYIINQTSPNTDIYYIDDKSYEEEYY